MCACEEDSGLLAVHGVAEIVGRAQSNVGVCTVMCVWTCLQTIAGHITYGILVMAMDMPADNRWAGAAYRWKALAQAAILSTGTPIPAQ